jgi:hypothetical protein
MKCPPCPPVIPCEAEFKEDIERIKLEEEEEK